ncbi:hypothetical protein ILYODFUR_036462 [Ilyodon furcidens]|uniref:Uncharacterized protein n=1 Tax=Ilyodon furcidens TaxID=33524 RepID=A0ABV0VK23_9TELE
MPFKHAVFPTHLLHSGRSYTPMHSNISLRLHSKILQGQLINLVSLTLPSPEVDHCVASPDGFTAVFNSSDHRLTKNLPFGKLVAAFKHFRDVSRSVHLTIE